MSANTTSSKQMVRNKLSSPAKRDALVSAQIANHIAAQIYNLRRDRNWTQTQLAKRTGMGQGRVSLLEDSNYDAIALRTLKRLASAFGVALRVEFVSFGDFLTWTGGMSPRDVRIQDFENEMISAPTPDLAASKTTMGNSPSSKPAATALAQLVSPSEGISTYLHTTAEDVKNQRVLESAHDNWLRRQLPTNANFISAAAQP